MLEMNVEIINDEKFARKRQCYFKKMGKINKKTRQTLLREGRGRYTTITRKERESTNITTSVYSKLV
jgi:hypothetical protein